MYIINDGDGDGDSLLERSAVGNLNQGFQYSDIYLFISLYTLVFFTFCVFSQTDVKITDYWLLIFDSRNFMICSTFLNLPCPRNLSVHL